MKLTRLRVEQLKQFRAALEINELDDGVNLFVGPNESGKTTIVDAIRAAFFERHKSSSVDNLRPWNDSGAAPEVELAFSWQDQPWKLSKRFLKRQRCDLQIGQQEFSGDEAEEKLAELMGYRFAGRGASKAEHHGIPGLLWVEQGAVQDIREPVSHAGNYLQSALGSSLGEVTSSGGDKLIEQVRNLRSPLLTPTGQPTGDYRKANAECEQYATQLSELDQQIKTYRDQVDELGRLRQQQHDIDAAQPWREQRQRAQVAENRLAEVRSWQEEQQNDHKALATCQQNLDVYRQQLKDFAAGQTRLAERGENKAEAQTAFDDCQARAPQLAQQHERAQKAWNKANDTFTRSRQQAARKRLQKEHDTLAESLASQKQALDDARTLQNELKQLREQQQSTAIDQQALAQLRQQQARLGELKIQREAVASRLSYDLAPGKSLNIGGETVTGQGERLLLDITQLTIADVGRLSLQPGGTDVAELARQQQQLETEGAALLQQLGVRTLAEGEQRAADNQKLGEQIDRQGSRLDGLAPRGVDALVEHYQLNDKQRAQLAEQLAELPQPEPDMPDEATAEQARDTAQEQLRAVEQAVHGHKRDLGMAQQALQTATDEWERLNNELQSPDRKAREQQVNEQLTDLKAEERQLNSRLKDRQKQIDAAQPEVLAQDLERYNRSAEAMEKQAAERAQAIARLQIQLETLGAEGLEEKRATLQQDYERLQRRRDELAQRAAALDLLLDLLREKRQALTRQLQAPLQKHLNHYLRLLFPQASLNVDEDLRPETLSRTLSDGEQTGDIADLSFGAREQMGLISRLAYADLLRGASRPTLLILDDALVHSDATRLAQMKRILFDAADRHQVLLFSCHPEKWRDLGARPRELQALKAGAA